MSSPRIIFRGKGCAPGEFEGEAVVSNQPFGFWQGIDPRTGLVIDRRHDLFGVSLRNKVFVFPFGRGSTGTPGIFLEAVRNGCAPAAIVNVKSEPMIVACALLAEAFFKVKVPIVDGLDEKPQDILRTGDRVRVNGATGEVEVVSRG
jgi:predicted aconitase with swiveling domain